jgi:hypothetical protein
VTLFDLIRAADDQTQMALEMTRAVLQHIRDLQDDDPGDNDALVLTILDDALAKARDLEGLIETLVRR